VKSEHKIFVTGINLNVKILLSIFLFSHFFCPTANSQPVQTNNDTLKLIDRGRKIENSISLFTSRSDYQTIEATTGRKFIAKPLGLIINGDSVQAKSISTRGQTTLLYRRKSFSFDLKSKVQFHHGDKTESLKRFFALSLSMDRNYCNNRLAFELMETSGLFSLFYSFCELRINGKNEGIYMIVERPEDWALKKKDSPLLIRRGYEHKMDKIATDQVIEKKETEKYCSDFRQIYRDLDKYDGEALYNNLSALLDLDFYMKWLAFNYLVRNGDYTDEVYFYFDPGINKFSIIPWDYDDLFLSAPHEGNIDKKLFEDKLIFSSEDMLDAKIASDTYLHNIYLVQFNEVLNKLSPDVLKRVFENTYAELYPYYSTNEIIKMSEYDAYKNVNFERLQNDMFALYNQLKFSISAYLENLRKK
jgi:spore coat protein H